MRLHITRKAMCCSLRTDGMRPFPNTRRRSQRIATWLHALNGLGWGKLFAGSIEEVIPLVEQAIRLSPRDPGIGSFYHLIGAAHLLQSDTDEAIVWLEKTRSAMPTVPMNRSRLAAAYAGADIASQLQRGG